MNEIKKAGVFILYQNPETEHYGINFIDGSTVEPPYYIGWVSFDEDKAVMKFHDPDARKTINEHIDLKVIREAKEADKAKSGRSN